MPNLENSYQYIYIILIIMIQQFSRLNISSQNYLFSQIGDSEIPSQLHNSAPIRKLDCIIIQNFKSFDKKYVGPFLNFTCIIGPNGSGKSNILDALMFCFCSQNSRHALIDARQLINRQGKQTFKQLSKLQKLCSVQAIFILADGQKFVICRSLDPEGKQQYLINYQIVNKKVYQNVLLRKGINCNSPNYAIWQGQIDRLLLKSPTQLAAHLQNISGSIYLKKPYQEIKEKLTNIQAEIEEKTRRINRFKVDKRNLKSLKQTSEQYNKYQLQYQQIMNKIYYLQTISKQRSLDQLVGEIKSTEEEQRKKVGEINELKTSAQRDYLQKTELQGALDRAINQLAQLYSDLKNVNNPANILKIQKLKQQQQRMREKVADITELEKKKQFLQQNQTYIPPFHIVQEYLKLYESWESENSNLHRQINKKKNQLFFVQGVIQSKADLIRQFEQKKIKQKVKREQKKQIIEDLKKNLQELGESSKAMQAESLKFSDQVDKFKKEFAKKNLEFSEVSRTIQQLENLISEQSQDERQADMLKNLASIDGFYGALHQKIKPSAGKYEVCFSIIFSGPGKYLLCQTEACSRKIGNRLKQIRLMKNVIILQNVAEKRTNDMRKVLGKDAVMAIDIVDLDQETKGLKQFLSQLLFGKVICDTLSNAYKIRNKNIEGVKQIYTLEGDVLRKDGLISSYGNTQTIKKTFRYSSNRNSLYQDLSKLSKEKVKLETELKNLRAKFDEKEIIKRNLELDQMSKKKQAIIRKIKEMEDFEDKDVDIPSSIMSQLKGLQRERQKLENSLADLQKMIKKSRIFDNFLEKHKIQNLQAFRIANNFEHFEQLMKKKNQTAKQISTLQQQIDRQGKEMERKKEEIKKMERQIQNLPGLGDQDRIERRVKEKQSEINQIRNKLSKLSNITKNQTIFQSKLPALEAKLVYAKQKIAKQLEDLAYQLGIQFRFPLDQEQILKQLGLPRRITDKVLQSLEEKLEKEKLKIQQHLDKHNSINLFVNVQADEEKIEKGMNNLLDEIQVSIKQRKRLSQELQNIRKDRAGTLLSFIKLLRQYLGESYKILTQQEDGATGNAVLYVQNEDQPFEHGIYYTPTPPTKRFVYDLQQLSGGQRSIASLALQYSLTLASKAPFLILDQTDAFLDVGNVSRFLNLINMSIKKDKEQIIVVTHKHGLFSMSESLIGVSRPKSLNLSQVYSLRLNDQ